MVPKLITLLLMLTVPVLAVAGPPPPDSSNSRYPSEEALRHYLTGRWLEQTGDSPGALAEMTRALSLDAGATSVLLRLSETASHAGEPARSLELAERALAIDPRDARALWLKGAALFNLRRPSEALTALMSATEADSEQVDYLRTLARVADAQDQTELARRAYARSVQLDESDGESWFQLAATSARTGRFGQADSALDRSLELNPMRPGVLFLRGWIRENLGDADGAITYYQHHLGIHDSDEATRRRLIVLLATRRRFAEAYVQARAVSAARPEDPEALQVEADLAFQAKKPSEGAKALARMRALSPDDATMAERYVLVLGRNERDRDAIAFADDWARTHASDPSAMLLTARARAMAGQFDAAAARAQLAVDAHPDSLAPRRLLARIQQDAKRWPEAIQAWQAVRSRSPSDAAVLLDLGFCLEQSGDVPAAVQAGRDALALAPHAPTVLNFLGYMLADHSRDLAEAEQLVSRALHQDPDNGAFIDSMGWVQFRLGRLAEARASLERAVELTGGDPVVHEHLGDVYKELQLIDLARREYRASLAAAAPNPRVRSKLEALR